MNRIIRLSSYPKITVTYDEGEYQVKIDGDILGAGPEEKKTSNAKRDVEIPENLMTINNLVSHTEMRGMKKSKSWIFSVLARERMEPVSRRNFEYLYDRSLATMAIDLAFDENAKDGNRKGTITVNRRKQIPEVGK